MTWLLLLILRLPSAHAEDWSAGRDHLNRVQQSYLKSDYGQMHSEIIQALRTTEDTVNREMALKWAKLCYAQNPKFELDKLDIQFELRRHKLNDRPLEFDLSFSAYVPRAQQIARVDVVTPEGQTLEVMGGQTLRKWIYPRFGTQDLVYRTQGLPVSSLSPGAYEFQLHEFSGRVLKQTLILWPSRDKTFLSQAHYDSRTRSVRWTLQKGVVADLFLSEGSSLRPIWSKTVSAQARERQGSLPLSPSSVPRRFELLIYEPIFKGPVSLLYMHSQEIDIP